MKSSGGINMKIEEKLIVPQLLRGQSPLPLSKNSTLILFWLTGHVMIPRSVIQTCNTVWRLAC